MSEQPTNTYSPEHPGHTEPYRYLDDEGRCTFCGRSVLEDENARLQACVEEEKGITDTAIRAMERAESDREGYKALAEQRGEALEEAQGKLDATKTAYMNHQWRKLGRILSKEGNDATS